MEMSQLRITALVNGNSLSSRPNLFLLAHTVVVGTFLDKYCRNGKIHAVHIRITPDKYALNRRLFVLTHLTPAISSVGRSWYGET
jgi:hypothetical protein